MEVEERAGAWAQRTGMQGLSQTCPGEQVPQGAALCGLPHSVHSPAVWRCWDVTESLCQDPRPHSVQPSAFGCQATHLVGTEPGPSPSSLARSQGLPQPPAPHTALASLPSSTPGDPGRRGPPAVGPAFRGTSLRHTGQPSAPCGQRAERGRLVWETRTSASPTAGAREDFVLSFLPRERPTPCVPRTQWTLLPTAPPVHRAPHRTASQGF